MRKRNLFSRKKQRQHPEDSVESSFPPKEIALNGNDASTTSSSTTTTTSSSSRGGGGFRRPSTSLLTPTPLHRVGASIGYSPTLHSLLTSHIPDFVVDEEDGIVAMFAEMNRSLPSTEDVQEVLRKTLHQMWLVWKQVKAAALIEDDDDEEEDEINNVASRAAHVSDDEDIGMMAMFREIGDATIPTARAHWTSAEAFMDHLLAQMLHTFAQKSRSSSFSTTTATTNFYDALPEIVAPTPTTDLSHEDLSPQAMIREISQQWSRPSRDVESYLLGRLQQIKEEAGKVEMVAVSPSGDNS